jgi:hypothetical protein
VPSAPRESQNLNISRAASRAGGHPRRALWSPPRPCAAATCRRGSRRPGSPPRSRRSGDTRRPGAPANGMQTAAIGRFVGRAGRDEGPACQPGAQRLCWLGSGSGSELDAVHGPTRESRRAAPLRRPGGRRHAGSVWNTMLSLRPFGARKAQPNPARRYCVLGLRHGRQHFCQIRVEMATGNSPSGFGSPSPSPRRKNFPAGIPTNACGGHFFPIPVTRGDKSPSGIPVPA